MPFNYSERSCDGVVGESQRSFENGFECFFPQFLVDAADPVWQSPRFRFPKIDSWIIKSGG